MAAIVSASAFIGQLASWLLGLGHPASLSSAPQITLDKHPVEDSYRESLPNSATSELLSPSRHHIASASKNCSEPTIILPDQGPVHVLDSACIDTAIAIALRARQQDSLGNSEAAGRLFAAALSHLSKALHDTNCIRDSHVRERLTMLRFLLEADGAATFDDLSAIANCPLTESADLPLPATSLRGACSFATTNALTLINQFVILWLVLLGNLFVWLAVQFRQSMLPEVAAKYLVSFGTSLLGTCKRFDVHLHLMRLGQAAAGWLIAVDRETDFSQKLLCSLAAVFGAVARVVEDSTIPANPAL